MSLVLRNAFVMTADAARSVHEKGALVARQGRIAYVGPDATCPIGLDDRVVDLGGRVLIPGLVNTHAHGGLTIQRGCCDDGDLFEWAQALAPHTSTISLEDNAIGCELAILEMVRGGITTVCDCARYGAGVFAAAARKIGMRSLSGALANSPSLRTVGKPNWPAVLHETKAAIAAHTDDPLAHFYLGAHSPYNCTPNLLQEVKAAANLLGLPFVIHAAENRKETDIVRERYGRRPIEHLHALGILDQRTLLAHAIWLDERDMDAIAQSGAAVAHNPVSNGKLASGVAPVPELRRRGVPVGLGTDSVLSNNALNLFQEMKFAVLLQRVTRLDGFALTAQDAFDMATREGARALGLGSEIGSLEIGKWADAVVLDLEHPLGLTPARALSDIVYAAGPQHVTGVLVGGEWVLENGRFTKVDAAALRAQARARYQCQ